MASASITVRKTKAGETRYQVRYRLGGRAYPPRLHRGRARGQAEPR